MYVNQESEYSKSLTHAALEALNSAEYIENYLDFVENVPDDIQRNITQLREIDQQYQEILQEIENFQNALKKELDPGSCKKTLFQVQRALIKTQDLGDKKLQISQIIQDIIESKSRQLESDRMKLDLGRDNEIQNESKNESIERPAKRSRRQRHSEVSLKDDSCHERIEKEVVVVTKTKKKKKRKSKVEKEAEEVPIGPIDPDEPTYCLCDQVSFGDMIGCDNGECEREWFHFSCVGLISKPRGKWYCPSCRADRSNQMKPKAT